MLVSFWYWGPIKKKIFVYLITQLCLRDLAKMADANCNIFVKKQCFFSRVMSNIGFWRTGGCHLRKNNVANLKLKNIFIKKWIFGSMVLLLIFRRSGGTVLFSPDLKGSMFTTNFFFLWQQFRWVYYHAHEALGTQPKIALFFNSWSSLSAYLLKPGLLENRP